MNNLMEEAGIAFLSSAVASPGALERTAHLLVADFAAPVSDMPKGPYLMGTVFKDLDGDGLYDPAEGLSDVQITVTDSKGNDDIVFTDSAGGFQVPVTGGFYLTTAYLPEGEETVNLEIGEANVPVRFIVEAPTNNG